MILTNLSQWKRYKSLHHRFEQLFTFLENNDLKALEKGRISLDGEDLFINVVELDAKEYHNLPLESHRLYIDVHILISGEETIGWLPTSDTQEVSSAYNLEDDYVLYSDRTSALVSVKPYQAVILFPEDAHVPGIGKGKICKLIAKVKI